MSNRNAASLTGTNAARQTQTRTWSVISVTHESTEPKPMQSSPLRRSLCPTVIIQSNNRRECGEERQVPVPRRRGKEEVGAELDLDAREHDARGVHGRHEAERIDSGATLRTLAVPSAELVIVLHLRRHKTCSVPGKQSGEVTEQYSRNRYSASSTAKASEPRARRHAKVELPRLYGKLSSATRRLITARRRR